MKNEMKNEMNEFMVCSLMQVLFAEWVVEQQTISPLRGRDGC